MTENEKHLQLLSIFHYVVGSIAGLFALFPIIHLTIGLIIVFAPETFASGAEQPPAFVGWIFVCIAVVIIVIGLCLAGCILAAGRALARRNHYTFCLVIAGVECIFFPFGTVLGVFTIIVLLRADTKTIFEPYSTPDPGR